MFVPLFYYYTWRSINKIVKQTYNIQYSVKDSEKKGPSNPWQGECPIIQNSDSDILILSMLDG